MSSRSCRVVKLPFQLLFLLLLITAGCGKNIESEVQTKSTERESPATESTGTPIAKASPRVVTDGLNRQVKLSRVPERIVSLAPKNTEELFAIGAGDRVVGVTSYCNFPTEARQRDQIGGFSSKSISLEKIVSLKPDLVVSAGEIHGPIVAELDRLEIPVMALNAESLDDLFRELKLLGTVVGCEEQATQLADRLQNRVRAVRDVSETIPQEKRASVFYMTWEEPLTAAGPSSYLGQMIQICGGANIFDDVTTRYPQISEEVLIDRNPEVILAASMGSMQRSVEGLRAKANWAELKAVRSGRIYLLDSDLVSRCGPRIVDALEDMAHALYPDKFPPRVSPANAQDRTLDGALPP